MQATDTTELLPQKKPFKMVDLLLKADDLYIETQFSIVPGNVLLRDNCLCEGGLIENMAQSIAAGSGYYYSQMKQSIPIGYIGAIKQIKISKLPEIGENIRTEIQITNKIGNASIAIAKIFLKEDLIASCELSIFVSQT